MEPQTPQMESPRWMQDEKHKTISFAKAKEYTSKQRSRSRDGKPAASQHNGTFDTFMEVPDEDMVDVKEF